MNVAAKAFVPNATAKAFVPNFGAPAEALPAVPRAAFFRYTMHVPAFPQKGANSKDSGVVDESATAPEEVAPAAEAAALSQATAFTVSQMLAKSCLRPSALGGPTTDALNEFALNYFQAAVARPDVSRLGFLATTEMLTAPSLTGASSGPTNFDNLPGYLLPLHLSTKPQQDHSRQLFAAWQVMLAALQSNPALKGLGHMTRTWKQDEDGGIPVVLHYFYLVFSTPGAISPEQVFELVTSARQVITLPRILPAIFDAYRLVAAVNIKEDSQGDAGVAEDPVFSECTVIQVPKTLDALPELCDSLAKLASDQSELVASKSIVLVVPSGPSTLPEGASMSSHRSGGQLRFHSAVVSDNKEEAEKDSNLSSPDLLRLVFRLCWDYMVLPCCLVGKESEVSQLASLHKKPIHWNGVSPLVSTLSCFANRHLKNAADSVAAMDLLAATVPSENQVTVVKQSDLTTILPITGRTGTPFNATGCLSPVEDVTAYQAVRDLVQQVAPFLDTHRDEAGDTTKYKRLRASNVKEATGFVAREQYRLRRTALGEQVLLVIDAVQNMFLVDAATKSFVVALPTWRNSAGVPMVWSGTGNFTGNCVLEGTLVPSFRYESNYKVIVEDVLMFNGNVVADSPLATRLSEIEGNNLEEEHNWPAASPSSIVILRSSYFTLDKGTQLLNTFVSEHPTQGLTFVPSKALGINTVNAGKRLPGYTWQLSDSVQLNFLAATVEDVSEAGAASPHQKINRVKLQTFEGAAANGDSFQSYNDEYVDYLVPTAPGVSASSTVQCLLIREADGAHWWEVIMDYSAFDRAVVDSKATVDALVHDPNVTSEEVHWLCTAQNFVCQECSKVDENGADDTTVHKFYCRSCWAKYGFGDCRSCNLQFTPGTVDSATGTFYCKACWNQFMTPPASGSGARQSPQGSAGPSPKAAPLSNMPHSPTSPNAPNSATAAAIAREGLASHVLSLAHKVLIDAACTKLSMSPTDVLELNCGASANLKRWVECGAQTYFGADISSTLLDEARANSENILSHVAAQNEEEDQSASATGGSSSSGVNLPHVEHLCGDVYHSDFWGTHIRKAHSAPFHVITCHQGLHQAQAGEGTAADASNLIRGVSGSLVPNGIFMALVLDATTIHQFLIAEGSEASKSGYHCPSFSIEQTAPKPRQEFTVSLNLGTLNGDKKNNVIQQSLQAADVTATVVHVAREHDLTPCASEIFASASASSSELPSLTDFLMQSERANDVGALMATASASEKKLFSFFRVLVLKKGAAIAPLSGPTHK